MSHITDIMFFFVQTKTLFKGLVKIEGRKSFKRVGTHDGRFHADEVMSTAILKEIFEIEVVRTRDLNKLKELDIIYDVGGGEFDHHGIEKSYRQDGIPFAACGLIWNKFGRDVISNKDASLTKEEMESVFYDVDRFLIEGIDAADNGIKTVEEIIPTMNISSIISAFNPPWNSEACESEAFEKAVRLATDILQNFISHRSAVLKARDLIIEGYRKRDIPEVLVLDTHCPWEEALQEIDKPGEVYFVVYPDKDNYGIQMVKGQDGSTRKYLPKSWAGKEHKELADITGVEDAVFCHTGRFFAVAHTLEGVMKMAKLALHSPREEENDHPLTSM